MDKYAIGEHGLVAPFSAMFENGDFTLQTGMPLLVNVRTLVRNVVGSYSLNDGTERDLLATLPEQLDVCLIMLSSAFENLYRIPVTYYYCDHSDVKYSALTHRINMTPKRELVAKWHKAGVDYVLANASVHTIEGSIQRPTEGIPEECGIITHYSQDLLHHRQFTRLVLLESHTGDVRGKDKFNKKLVLNKEQQTLIPFNKFTQRVFGDNTLFGPAPLDVRRNITDIAKDTGWTSNTPLNRVRFLLNQQNPALANLFSPILH